MAVMTEEQPKTWRQSKNEDKLKGIIGQFAAFERRIEMLIARKAFCTLEFSIQNREGGPTVMVSESTKFKRDDFGSGSVDWCEVVEEVQGQLESCVSRGIFRSWVVEVILIDGDIRAHHTTHDLHRGE